MVSTAKLAKLTGWLLVVATLVIMLMTAIKPGTFTTDNPEGAVAAIREAVRHIAANSELVHISVEVSLFATLAFLLGFAGLERLFRDGSWGDYMRKAALLAMVAGYAIRLTSYAMAHLASNVLTHRLEGADGSLTSTDAATIILGMEGTLGVFATLTTRTGMVLVAFSLLNRRLIGSDRTVGILLGILPGFASMVFLVLGSHISEGVITIYLIGNLFGFIQALWVVLVGMALIRKGDTLPALS